MLVSRGKKLLFVDADGATLFSDIEKLEKVLPGSGIAIGSRAHMVHSDAVVKVSSPLSRYATLYIHLQLANTSNSANTPSQHPHARLSLPCRDFWNQDNQRHTVRVQALYAFSRTSYFPTDACRAMDLRY
jgi:hypothetical protein